MKVYKDTKLGYLLEFCPGHPNAKNNGCVYQHRIVMERYLGRYLSSKECVHHKNGIKDDKNGSSYTKNKDKL